MPDISILKAAAERVDQWLVLYGIDARWHADSAGLTLSAGYGHNTIKRTVSWFELEQSRYPANLLEHTESAVLAGLSD